MTEANLEEENIVKSARVQSRPSSVNKSGEKSRKWDNVGHGSKSYEKCGECVTCGRKHEGMCWKATGGCARCDSKKHRIKNCPQMDQGQQKIIGDDTRA